MADQREDNQLDGLLSEDEIRRRMNDALEKAAEYQRQAEGWRLILRGRRALSGQPNVGADESGNDHPGNTEAILRVMADEPNRVWTAVELYNALEDRGWLPRASDPRKSMGATLSVMTSRGRLQRVGRGSYRLSRLVQTRLSSVGGESD